MTAKAPDAFRYKVSTPEVIFGRGSISQLPAELDRLGLRRVVVLSTPTRHGLAERVARLLPERVALIHPAAVMHTPVEVTEEAVARAEGVAADGVISIGGGSTIGLGKAMILRRPMRHIAIPTTYAGSEATPILGQTAGGKKTTMRDMKLLPEVIIYDVDLTLTLPVKVAATSGLNAIAHAVEALYARDANPIISMIAEAGIEAIAKALPSIAREPQNVDARSQALYGAWLCGTCLGAVGMSLHHKLCHVLGGAYGLPHAETHSVVLPHAIAYNAPAIPDALAITARALSTSNPAQELYRLVGNLGVGRSLKSLGMPEDGIEKVARLAMEDPYWNPRPIEREPLLDLLKRAWAGLPPATDRSAS